MPVAYNMSICHFWTTLPLCTWLYSGLRQSQNAGYCFDNSPIDQGQRELLVTTCSLHHKPTTPQTHTMHIQHTHVWPERPSADHVRSVDIISYKPCTKLSAESEIFIIKSTIWKIRAVFTDQFLDEKDNLILSCQAIKSRVKLFVFLV